MSWSSHLEERFIEVEPPRELRAVRSKNRRNEVHLPDAHGARKRMRSRLRPSRPPRRRHAALAAARPFLELLRAASRCGRPRCAARRSRRGSRDALWGTTRRRRAASLERLADPRQEAQRSETSNPREHREPVRRARTCSAPRLRAWRLETPTRPASALEREARTSRAGVSRSRAWQIRLHTSRVIASSAVGHRCSAGVWVVDLARIL